MNEAVILWAFERSDELADILNTRPTALNSAAHDTIDRLLTKTKDILAEGGYPTTSMELDSIVNQQIALDQEPDDLPIQATMFLRLIHLTKTARDSGDTAQYRYLSCQLMRSVYEGVRMRQIKELRPYAETGMKVHAGGVKGAKKRAQIEEEKDNRAEILDYCNYLLEQGHDGHEIAGMAHGRFSNRPGFPSSKRQYRTITKALRDSLK